jgi:CDP-glucose 4,6-dehydratase
MGLDDFYRDKSVLLTGHTGFKGSWLAIWLQQMGARVTGYALEPESQPNLFEYAGVERGLTSVISDIRDFTALEAVFAQARPDLVFHLAAQPLVRRSYRMPRETFETNVGGTVNVLEAIRRTPSVKGAVIVTTDKCYENREWIWGYRENDRLGGHDPYSASKAATELATTAYLRSFFSEGAEGPRVALASVRAGNVIGGGDWSEDRILPDAIRAVAEGRPLEVRRPDAIRPWQFVLDPLGGYLALMQRLVENPNAFQGAWNFGPAHSGVMTVAQLVSQFVKTLGRGSWRDVSSQQVDAPHEAGLLWLCCDKAAALLRWNPVWSVEQAVEATAAWYRAVLFEEADASASCLEDIENYIDTARDRGEWWAR